MLPYEALSAVPEIRFAQFSHLLLQYIDDLTFEGRRMHLKAILQRLDEIERELQELRAEVEKTLIVDGDDETELFLRKCRGWQDERTPDELIARISASPGSMSRWVSSIS